MRGCCNGSQVGLKNRWEQSREGSSPSPRTKGLRNGTFLFLNKSITNPYIPYGTKAFIEVQSIKILGFSK